MTLVLCWFMEDSGRDEYIPEAVIMAGGDQSGEVSTCKGDSGSPVVLQGNVVIGLVSWSKGCGWKFRPSVWTWLEPFVPWIRDKISAGNSEF